MPVQERKQNVSIDRKTRLRRRVITSLARYDAPPVTAAYLPFCGDGDMALSGVYGDRLLLASDLDAARVETFTGRFPDADARVADCDRSYPWGGDTPPLSIIDADAYSYPYAAFRVAWEQGNLADHLALFFTDAQKQSVIRNTHWRRFGADRTEKVDDLKERRRIFNLYLRRYVRPEFEEYLKPWRVSDVKFYNRGQMVYWGCLAHRQ